MNKVLKFFHHHFIPSEHNNFKAKIWHLDFLTSVLIVFLFLSFVSKNDSVSKILGIATDIKVTKIIELTNKEREKFGLKPLKENNNLNKAAYDKAINMFEKNYWAHYGPDGKTPWEFILNSGYKYEYAGENLAKDFMYSPEVVTAWMDSPSHKENIVNTNYSEIGVAVVNGRLNNESTTLVVQMFAKPSIEPISIKIPVQNQVLAASNNTLKTPVKTFSFNFGLIVFVLLLTALIFDLYFTFKLNLHKISGKNLAHFLFLAFIIVSLFFVSKGLVI